MAEDLILTQGGTLNHRFLLYTGAVAVASTTASANTRITTASAHCLAIGDRIVINHDLGDTCESLPQCATVTNIVSDTVLDIDYETTVDSLTSGFIAKALDLTGLRLIGNISTRAGANTTDPLVGSLASALAQYPNSIVVQGSTDFMAGDRVSVPGGNISGAQVRAVYSLGSNPNSVLLELSENHNSAFTDSAISRTGGTLLEFEFSYLDDDPQCGVIDGYISGAATRDLSIALPGGCDPCNSYLIGCYTIGLVRGYDNVPAHYPAGDYNDSAQVIKSGSAYLKPSGLSF